ncbi:MAG TPA: hypothetical protein VNT24_14110 [Propionibacteriaceae bacterium]|nr:hypothetical protein [Propionibacteriaceae bacterium]
MTVGRWEALTNWPLTVASVLFLAAYATLIIAPDLPTCPPKLAVMIETPRRSPTDRLA